MPVVLGGAVVGWTCTPTRTPSAGAPLHDVDACMLFVFLTAKAGRAIGRVGRAHGSAAVRARLLPRRPQQMLRTPHASPPRSPQLRQVQFEVQPLWPVAPARDLHQTGGHALAARLAAGLGCGGAPGVTRSLVGCVTTRAHRGGVGASGRRAGAAAGGACAWGWARPWARSFLLSRASPACQLLRATPPWAGQPDPRPLPGGADQGGVCRPGGVKVPAHGCGGWVIGVPC